MSQLQTYHSWRDVPSHLMTKTQLGELEFPRAKTTGPAAIVHGWDWRGKDSTDHLYDAREQEPTRATAAVLEAAGARATRSRVCARCDARADRLLPVFHGRALCRACLIVAQLREEQEKLAQARPQVAARVQAALALPRAAVVQADVTLSPAAGGDDVRRASTVRIRAVDVERGRRLLDCVVALVGPRSPRHDPAATPLQEGRRLAEQALAGRPLLVWSHDDLTNLHRVVPDWKTGRRLPGYFATDDSTAWRGVLSIRGGRQAALPPGAPDRLLLHLRRIAATAPTPSAELERGSDEPG